MNCQIRVDFIEVGLKRGSSLSATSQQMLVVWRPEVFDVTAQRSTQAWASGDEGPFGIAASISYKWHCLLLDTLLVCHPVTIPFSWRLSLSPGVHLRIFLIFCLLFFGKPFKNCFVHYFCPLQYHDPLEINRSIWVIRWRSFSVAFNGPTSKSGAP
jgi:hypothetical protein